MNATMVLSQPAAVAFWLLSAMTLGSACLVAFSRSIVTSAFSLLATFLGVAGIYIFLSADFIAVTQILIYVGGVLVLILFAVMLTSRIDDLKVTNRSVGIVPAGLVTACLCALVVGVGIFANWLQAPTPRADTPTAELLGELFLTKYLLPFEIASVLLLAALVGAVVMARKEIKPD